MDKQTGTLWPGKGGMISTTLFGPQFRDQIAAQISAIMHTPECDGIARTEAELEDVRKEWRLLDTPPPDILELDTRLAETRLRVLEAKEEAKQLTTAVRQGRLERAAAPIAAAKATLQEIQGIRKQIETVLARRRRDQALVVRGRRQTLVNVRMVCIADVQRRYKRRQAYLAHHWNRMRRNISALREQVWQNHRDSVVPALDAVDEWPNTLGLGLGFTRSRALPFHEWLQNDPELAAWCRPETVLDVFERTVSQIKEQKCRLVFRYE